MQVQNFNNFAAAANNFANKTINTDEGEIEKLNPLSMFDH